MPILNLRVSYMLRLTLRFAPLARNIGLLNQGCAFSRAYNVSLDFSLTRPYLAFDQLAFEVIALVFQHDAQSVSI
jgi:hypothetical protein